MKANFSGWFRFVLITNGFFLRIKVAIKFANNREESSLLNKILINLNVVKKKNLKMVNVNSKNKLILIWLIAKKKAERKIMEKNDR